MALYDVEGRKLREVVNNDAYDDQFIHFNEFFGEMKFGILDLAICEFTGINGIEVTKKVT